MAQRPGAPPPIGGSPPGQWALPRQDGPLGVRAGARHLPAGLPAAPGTVPGPSRSRTGTTIVLIVVALIILLFLGTFAGLAFLFRRVRELGKEWSENPPKPLEQWKTAAAEPLTEDKMDFEFPVVITSPQTPQGMEFTYRGVRIDGFAIVLASASFAREWEDLRKRREADAHFLVCQWYIQITNHKPLDLDSWKFDYYGQVFGEPQPTVWRQSVQDSRAPNLYQVTTVWEVLRGAEMGAKIAITPPEGKVVIVPARPVIEPKAAGAAKPPASDGGQPPNHSP